MKRYLGFGLNDLTVDVNGIINYPRVNLEALKTFKEKTVQDYADFLNKKYDDDTRLSMDSMFIKMNHKEQDYSKIPASKYLHLDDSESDEQIEGAVDGRTALLIQPYGAEKSWTHSSDMIDMIEAEEDAIDSGDDPTRNTWTSLTYGQYPYNFGYWNLRTGQKLNPTDADIWNMCQNLMYSPTKNKRRESKRIANEIVVKNYDFKNFKEATEHIIPAVDQSVVDIVEFLDIFVDLETAHTLRPAILTIWS